MNKILASLTILLVEDDGEARKLMQELLQGEFAKVIIAQNGDEGLKKFKKFNPDMVVTDIAMPILGGLEMAQEVKKISKDTPVIALSAFSEKERLLKAIDIGIDKYVLKPVDMDEFLPALEKLAQDKIAAVSVIEISSGLSFNKIKRVLIKEEEEISLTKKELSFVSLLIKRLGTVVPHEEIKNVVWVGESVSEAAIRTFVKRLRDKVGTDFIKNSPGLGYKIDANFK